MRSLRRPALLLTSLLSATLASRTAAFVVVPKPATSKTAPFPAVVTRRSSRAASAAAAIKMSTADGSDGKSTAAADAAKKRVLVVGSINVDVYKRLDSGGSARFGGDDDGRTVSISPVKGMTLPASSFLRATASSGNDDDGAGDGGESAAESFVLTMDGPFTYKTGGKGANAAAAAGQTSYCEFVGNFGSLSETENESLLRSDLATFGNVDVTRCATLPDVPTGTAYILLFEDGDNAIVLIGGANQRWPSAEALRTGEEGKALRDAVSDSVCVMLQREVPEYVNVVTADLARAAVKPVFMDVGGTDAPLDSDLMPHVSVIAPNESELTFISGVETRNPADGKVESTRVREAAQALRAKFAEVGNKDVDVLVTLGGMGSMYLGSDGTEHHVGTFSLGTPDGKPVDTTGAGDCYRGSFVAARYAEGKSVREAMEWAACAGSLAVEVEGAMPSMPTRGRILERLQQQKPQLR